MGRHGLTRHHDIGLLQAGTLTRLEVRGEWSTSEGSTRTTWMWAIAPYGGAVMDHSRAARGGRIGVDVPLTWGADFGGMYDVWAGVSARDGTRLGSF